MKRFITLLLGILLCNACANAQSPDLVNVNAIGFDSVVIDFRGGMWGKFIFKGTEYRVLGDAYDTEYEYVGKITKNIMDSVLLPVDSVFIKKYAPVELQYNYTGDEIVREGTFIGTKIYTDTVTLKTNKFILFNYGRWEVEFSPAFEKLYTFLYKKSFELHVKYVHEKYLREREERKRARLQKQKIENKK